MTEAIKADYDTLTSIPRQDETGGRTPAHYLEKWKRKRGLIQRPGGGKIEKFRKIARYQNITPWSTVSDEMPQVVESEYNFYKWNVGKLLCVYCNKELTSANRTQDHVIPRCRGGSDLGRDNLEPACIECNSAKGDMSLLEYLATRKTRDR